MTYRERVTIEHPEAVSHDWGGGVAGCPRFYGYEDTCPCTAGSQLEECTHCWDREAPPRKVKPRRKKNATI